MSSSVRRANLDVVGSLCSHHSNESMTAYWRRNTWLRARPGLILIHFLSTFMHICTFLRIACASVTAIQVMVVAWTYERASSVVLSLFLIFMDIRRSFNHGSDIISSVLASKIVTRMTSKIENKIQNWQFREENPELTHLRIKFYTQNIAARETNHQKVKKNWMDCWIMFWLIFLIPYISQANYTTCKLIIHAEGRKLQHGYITYGIVVFPVKFHIFVIDVTKVIIF